MEKHAYLIIAYNKFQQLSLLLKLLDDDRNDIYVLIDKKSPLTSETRILLRDSIQKSNLYLYNDISIEWGDYSQIRAEIELFKHASKNNYIYYHLLSGQDLPLHNQDYMHSFFDKNPNKIFLTIPSKSIYQKNNIPDRVIYNYHFIKFYGRSHLNKYEKKVFRILENFNFLIQRLSGKTNRIKKSLPIIQYASNWVSLDNDSVEYLLKNDAKIKNMFSKSFLCDELFVPTILLNNPKFKKKLYLNTTVHDRPNELQGNLRYINWWDGSPHIWNDDDLEKIKYAQELGHLFSRKFDLNNSPKMKQLILEMCNHD